MMRLWRLAFRVICIWTTWLGLERIALACCEDGHFSVYPAVGTILGDRDPIILEGHGNWQVNIETISEFTPRLVADGECVSLSVVRMYPGVSRVSAVWLVHDEPLVVGHRYRLVLRFPERGDVEMTARETRAKMIASDPVVWTVGRSESVRSMRVNGDPVVKTNFDPSIMGVNVQISVVGAPEGSSVLLASVQQLGASDAGAEHAAREYPVEVKSGIVLLETDICMGEFALQSAGRYRVTLSTLSRPSVSIGQEEFVIQRSQK